MRFGVVGGEGADLGEGGEVEGEVFHVLVLGGGVDGGCGVGGVGAGREEDERVGLLGGEVLGAGAALVWGGEGLDLGR